MEYPCKDSFKELYDAKDASSKEKAQISTTDANEVFNRVHVYFLLYDSCLNEYN